MSSPYSLILTMSEGGAKEAAKNLIADMISVDGEPSDLRVETKGRRGNKILWHIVVRGRSNPNSTHADFNRLAKNRIREVSKGHLQIISDRDTFIQKLDKKYYKFTELHGLRGLHDFHPPLNEMVTDLGTREDGTYFMETYAKL